MDDIDWQDGGSFSEFYAEGHIPVSREMDENLRVWLTTDHCATDNAKRLHIEWSWQEAPNDGRPVTVAKVRW